MIPHPRQFPKDCAALSPDPGASGYTDQTLGWNKKHKPGCFWRKPGPKLDFGRPYSRWV